ncbi:MAG: hypothetical protein LC650_00555 [Actinobacteria bacterium]|nr:hypothetical protein [Actinomycetota bacterium]
MPGRTEAVPKLTEDQAFLVTAWTGKLAMRLDRFHAKAEARLYRPIYTHEMGGSEFWVELRDEVYEDFLSICNDNSNEE